MNGKAYSCKIFMQYVLMHTFTLTEIQVDTNANEKKRIVIGLYKSLHLRKISFHIVL